MLSKIRKILNIIDDPSFVFIGIFRVDGDPVLVRCKDKIAILRIIDWLDRYIKMSLEKMITEELSEVGTRFKDLFVRIIPISKTLVLVVVSNEEISLYRFEIDIASLKALIS